MGRLTNTALYFCFRHLEALLYQDPTNSPVKLMVDGEQEGTIRLSPRI